MFLTETTNVTISSGYLDEFLSVKYDAGQLLKATMIGL
jgi:hypothetical protein